MRWLDEDPTRLRMECTAFGLNLVSGNDEFACLIAIEDEEFWARFGGMVQANWEATGLRHYSSRDPELLSSLIQDQAWSNEGLFALLQGLRRLTETRRPSGGPTNDRMGSTVVSDNWRKGNAYEDSQPTRGWLLGHFIDPSEGIRSTQAVEIKWGVHP